LLLRRNRAAQSSSGDFVMNKSLGFMVAASFAATAWLVAPAGAGPIGPLSALQNAMHSSVEAVQYRGQHGNRGYRGSGWVGPGIAGALIGSAIIGATQPYGYYDNSGYGAYGAYEPGYDQGYVAASPYADGREVTYCVQRFRSYDVASGTYLGFDGLRHSCL
jgi:hypothetical protein